MALPCRNGGLVASLSLEHYQLVNYPPVDKSDIGMKSYLSIPHRVELLKRGLLPESHIRELIFDALAHNLVHYLPAEVQAYGRELLKKHRLTHPES